MQTIGRYNSPYDRFCFDAAGYYCAIWSSINADALLISITSGQSVFSLGNDVGYAAAFCGDMFAICSSASIRLYSMPSSFTEPVAIIPVDYSASADQPVALAFSQSGHHLVFGAGPIVRLIDVGSKHIAKFDLPGANALFVGFDSEILAYTVMDFDCETANLSVTNFQSGINVFSTAISPLAFPMLSAAGLRFYISIDKPYYRSEVWSPPDGVASLFLPYSKLIAFCNNDCLVVQFLQSPAKSLSQSSSGHLVCWDITHRSIIAYISTNSSPLLIAGSRSSDRIALVYAPTLENPSGRIDIMSARNLDMISCIHTGNLAVRAVAVSPRGDYLIISADGIFIHPGVYEESEQCELFLSFVN